MKTPEQRRALVATETADFLMYRASNQSAQLVKFLDALIDDHLADLAIVSLDRLQYKQGAIRQLQALRDVLVMDNISLSPKA